MENILKSRPAVTPDLIGILIASLPGVPDAIASSVLAGINPSYGLSSLIIETPIAALFNGSALRCVATISAFAVALGTALSGHQGLN